MADQRIQYSEEMVGAGHPTKGDTLNRLALIDHGTDGQHTLSSYQGSAYAADSAASDAYVVTLDPVPAAYFNGMVVNFKATTINTGAATLNVNGLGAIDIKKFKDQALEDGDIEAGQMVQVIYNSTGPRFEMVNPPATYTGSGAGVRATSPTLVTPLLGTPTSGDLTNCITATPAVNDNSTKLATTEFIQTKFGVYDIHEITELCSVD